MSEEVVEKIIEWIESSASFIQAELPDYVNQFMRSELIKSWIGLSFLLILFIITISIQIFCIYKYHTYEKYYDASCIIVMGCLLPLAFYGLAVVGLSNEINRLIIIYAAPKVYILNHLKSLLG